MSANRELSLHLKVTNPDVLDKVSAFATALAALGPQIRSSMSGAAAAADATKQDFSELVQTTKAGFNSLQAEFVRLTSTINTLATSIRAIQTDAAATDAAADKTRKRTRDTENEIQTVAKLRAERQKLYEADLKGGATGFGLFELKTKQVQGVRLSPEDATALKVAEDRLAAIKALQADERKFGIEQAKAIEENAARTRAAGVLHSKALDENAARDRASGVLHSKALEENAARTRAAGVLQSKAMEENAARDRASGVLHSKALEENAARTRAAGVLQSKAMEENAARDRAAGVLQSKAMEENAARTRASGVIQARAMEENAARDRAAGVLQSKAMEENAARTRAAGVLQAKAMEENEARTRKLGLAQLRAVEEDIARSRAMSVAHEQAIAENARRQKAEESLLAARERLIARKIELDAKYAAATAAGQLKIAQQAQTFLQTPGTTTAGATVRYGPSAVNAAQDAAEMLRLASAAKEVTNGLAAKGDALKKLKPDLVDHTAHALSAGEAYNYMHTSLRGLAGGMGQIWLTWGKPLTALWAGFAVSTGLKESIKQFAAFEHQLAIIGAVSGETQKSLDAIGASALEMGKNSTFGTQGLVEGIRILSQAGVAAGDAVNMLPQIAQFAQVAEISLPQAAQSALGIATAFGKPLTAISATTDVIGKAAAISQTSVEAMTNAIRQSSTVAEQYGASIEEVGAALAVLAKRNIEASAAGTALRNAYNEIYAPTDKAQAALTKLGISGYDNAGKMKPLVQVFTEMKAAVSELDKQSQNKFLQVIFGERGGKVGSALLNDLGAFTDDLKKLENAAGFTAQAAALIEQSVESKWKVALNTLKNSFIEAGKGSEESVRQLIETLRIAFGDPAVQVGITNITIGLVKFAEVLVSLGPTLLTVFGVILAKTAVSGVAALLASLGSMITTLGLASVATLGMVPSLVAKKAATDAAAASLVRLEAAQAAAAFGTGAMVSGIGAAVAGFARFLPAIGTFIIAVTAAGDIWDYFRRKKDLALQGGSQQIVDQGNMVKKLAQDQVKAAEAAENAYRGNDSGDVKSAESEAFQRARQSFIEQAAKAEEAAKKIRDAGLENARLAREGSGLSAEAYKRNVENVNARFKASTEAAQGLLKTQLADVDKSQATFDDALKRQANTAKAKEAADKANQLATGSRKIDFGETGRGGAHAALGVASAEKVLFGFDTREITKAAEDKEKILRARRSVGLIEEEQFQDDLFALNKKRLDDQIAAATSYIEKLPEMEKRALALVSSTDPRTAEMEKDRIKKTVEGYKKGAEATISDARRAANLDEELEKIRAQGRDKKSLEDFQKQQAKYNSDRAEQNRKGGIDIMEMRRAEIRQQELLDVQQNGELMTAVEKKIAEARIRIQNEMAAKIKQAEKDNNVELADRYRELQAELEQIAMEGARRRAERERSLEFGVMKGLVSYIDSITDLSASGAKLVGNSTKAVEDFFVNMATKGKMSFGDLANSIIADLTRIAVQTQITGPLSKMLMGYLGGAFGTPASADSFNSASLVSVGHIGGVIGSDSLPSRSVSPSLFSGAPRFHGGGLVGGEVPIIAQQGEMILTKQQQAYMRGAMDKGSSQPAPEVQVNVINNGTPSNVAGTETKFDGKKMIVNVILEDMKRNGPIAQSMARSR